MIIRLLALLIITLMFSGSSFAQSSDEEIRYYDVEIIIFKNIRVPKGQELVPPVSSPIKDAEFLDLSSPASIRAAAKKSYEVLKPEQLRLRDRVEKIVESPYYELLVHTGWRQPGLEKEKAMPVWISGGRKFGSEYISIDNHMINLANSDANEFANNSSGLESPTPTTLAVSGNEAIYELEGTITIALARYLHTYPDLVLRRPRLEMDETQQNPEQEELSARDLADTRILNNHSLKESRRMRSKTLHYLDNPEFGMLVLITPYLVETTNTAATQ